MTIKAGISELKKKVAAFKSTDIPSLWGLVDIPHEVTKDMPT